MSIIVIGRLYSVDPGLPLFSPKKFALERGFEEGEPHRRRFSCAF